jgi:hypothetical protein
VTEPLSADLGATAGIDEPAELLALGGAEHGVHKARVC